MYKSSKTAGIAGNSANSDNGNTPLNQETPDSSDESKPVKEDAIASKNNEAAEEESDSKMVMEKVLLDVPFIIQAPDGNWDNTHEEACEEASLIMIKNFIDKKSISTSSGDSQMLDMIDWETKKGLPISITLNQLNSIAREYYNLDSGRIVTNPTLDQFKKELADGKPIILPAAGKVLENPNFRNGGPNYHMLVIKGYDKNGFITNDPGTKKGEGYRYSFSNLIESMHDYDSSDILLGQKAFLVFD